jgi:hypothetical protein
MGTMKGFYQPKNPKKYGGNKKNIVYRSSYELKYMLHLDNDPDTILWFSEEVSVPYESPKDKRIHLYYPDFVVKKKVGDKIKTYMIEIKPATQAKKPSLTNKNGNTKNTKTRLNESLTYHINQAKWASARAFCKDKNWEFAVLTEVELGINR